MSLIMHLEVTEQEIDLIDLSIRTQIYQFSHLGDADTAVDAIEKHEKVLALLRFLKKLHQHQETSHFDRACGLQTINLLS